MQAIQRIQNKHKISVNLQKLEVLCYGVLTAEPNKCSFEGAAFGKDCVEQKKLTGGDTEEKQEEKGLREAFQDLLCLGWFSAASDLSRPFCFLFLDQCGRGKRDMAQHEEAGWGCREEIQDNL